MGKQANNFRKKIDQPTSFNPIDPENFMKQTQKLITLVLLALALNAAGETVEAKSLSVKSTGAAEPSKINTPKK